MAEDKDIKASKLRLGEQAALMLNIQELLTKQPEPEKEARNVKTYQNFAIFRTTTNIKDSASGGHIALTKALFRNDNIEYLSNKLPSSILSILQPSIKIYKVIFPTKESKGIQWRIPFDDSNFKFESNYTKTSQFVNSSLDELIAGTGRMHAVGIKSFSYKYEGTNPAEVNTNISADLSLYFQDVRDLVKEINVAENDTNFEGNAGSKFNFSYADLVADSTRKDKDGNWNKDYFRIKVIAGYADLEKNYIQKMGNFTDSEVEKIIEAVKTSKVIFYLTPHNHDITFDENGSITINIKYIASTASILASLDILSIGSEGVKSDLEKSKKSQEDKQAEIKKKRESN